MNRHVQVLSPARAAVLDGLAGFFIHHPRTSILKLKALLRMLRIRGATSAKVVSKAMVFCLPVAVVSAIAVFTATAQADRTRPVRSAPPLRRRNDPPCVDRRPQRARNATTAGNLQVVIKAWDTLPEAVRAGILTSLLCTLQPATSAAPASTLAATLDTGPVASGYPSGVSSRLSANHFRFARSPIGSASSLS